jgi:hypothetical protein
MLWVMAFLDVNCQNGQLQASSLQQPENRQEAPLMLLLLLLFFMRQKIDMTHLRVYLEHLLQARMYDEFMTWAECCSYAGDAYVIYKNVRHIE